MNSIILYTFRFDNLHLTWIWNVAIMFETFHSNAGWSSSKQAVDRVVQHITWNTTNGSSSWYNLAIWPFSLPNLSLIPPLLLSYLTLITTLSLPYLSHTLPFTCPYLHSGAWARNLSYCQILFYLDNKEFTFLAQYETWAWQIQTDRVQVMAIYSQASIKVYHTIVICSDQLVVQIWWLKHSQINCFTQIDQYFVAKWVLKFLMSINGYIPRMQSLCFQNC